jgi:hypothetical protein
MNHAVAATTVDGARTNMTPMSIQKLKKSPPRGVALIVTLLILFFVTLLVVTFAVSTQVELMETQAVLDLIYARQLAEGGVDYAIGLLRAGTPVMDTSLSWVNRPEKTFIVSAGSAQIATQILYSVPSPVQAVNTSGSLITISTQTNQINYKQVITGDNELYSRIAVTTGVYMSSQKISNETGWVDYPITNALTVLDDPPILPGWVTIAEDGTAPGIFLVGGVTNRVPLRGRWSVWVDSEANKVNINHAKWRRLLTDSSESHPTNIDLTALARPFWRRTNVAEAFYYTHEKDMGYPGWYTTLEEMRLGFDPPLSQRGFNSNKFYSTVYSWEHNIDAFGRDRVNLHALTNLTSAAYDIAGERLAEAHYAETLYKTIVTDTDRNTLTKKYGNFGAHQILANIIEYQLAHDPQRPAAGNVAPGPGLGADGIPIKWSGLKKGPMISQILVHVATNEVFASGNTTNLEVRAFFDAKLVNPYELARGSNYVVKILPDTITLTGTNAAPGGADFNITIAGTELSSTLQRDVQSHSFGLLGANSGSADLGAAPPPSVMQLVEGWEKTTGPVDQRAPGAPVVTNVSITLKTVRLLSSGGDTNIVDWMTASDFEAAFNALGRAMRFPRASFPQSEIVTYPAVTNNFDNASSPHFRPVSLGKQDPRARTFPGWTAGSGDFANSGPNLQTNWFVYSYSQINPVSDDTASTEFTSRISPEVYALLADTRPAAPGISTPSHRNFGAMIREGLMDSSGELSYIHSGYPWRTIRFLPVHPPMTNEPAFYSFFDPRLDAPYTGVGNPNTGLRGIETNAVADWVLMDMFKTSDQERMPGRININAKFTGPASNLNDRIPPVRALILNAVPGLEHTTNTVYTDVPLLIYNSGVDANAQVLPGGASDPNYYVVSGPSGSGAPGPAKVVTTVPTSWFPNSDTSKWIAPPASAANANAPRGRYVYRTTFDIPADADPDSAVIRGSWATATVGENIQINNTFTGFGTSGTGSMSDFIIDAVNFPSGTFTVGQNTLRFHMRTGNVGATGSERSAIRVELGLTARMPTNLFFPSRISGEVASNIVNRVMTNNLYRSPYQQLPAYLTIGELCEVNYFQYYSNTVSATPPTQAQRQQMIRRVSNLATTRSEVFSIWSMGQVILDRDKDGHYDWVLLHPKVVNYGDPAEPNWLDGDGDGDGDGVTGPGTMDTILSEILIQAVVERYVEDGRVKFRTLYSRYVY